ncbi:hypothetical protein B0H16DRAFT_134657 [Mycena metata]|uniref:TEA domain-containing protein n=1 Tax=Mycena metata TaxID=1033252 RepID=A0AAD7I5V8_9AGAR|nr:hypothetical protein B0H16DRAFT_134657 [Mycena metata]
MTHGFFVDTGSHRTMSRAALQVLLGSRRGWKRLHGEEVWPLHLEAALIEALEQYVPDNSRETRLLGRYRGRNQFIAAYILRRTGEHRTSKQVGSRLQQMRHCTRNSQIRNLLDPLRSDSYNQHQDMHSSSSADWSGLPPCPVHLSILTCSRPACPLPATRAFFETQYSTCIKPYLVLAKFGSVQVRAIFRRTLNANAGFGSGISRTPNLNPCSGSVRRSNTFEPGRDSGFFGVQKLVPETTYGLFRCTHLGRRS